MPEETPTTKPDEMGDTREFTFKLTPFENGIVVGALWYRRNEICERIASKLYEQFAAQAGPR